MSNRKETEFGVIPIHWHFIRASEYCSKVTDGTHDSPKQQTIGRYLITSKHIKSREIDFESAYLISQEDFEKINKRSYVERWDVIISMIGEYCGFTYVERNENIDYAVKNVGLFKTGSELKALWLHYFLNSTIGTYILDINKSGSSQPYIALGSLRELPILNPPLNEKTAIVSVLSSLDDKIDLLHRQNATLEKMAETLFRQWFVEEAKEEWEIKPLGSLVTVKRGGSPRPIQDYLSDTGLRWLKISDATKENSPYIFEIKEHIKIEGLNKTTHLKAGTLVLSNSATPGIPKILHVDTCIHDGWLHFPKSHFSNEFLYLLFKKIRPELLQQGNGSIFTNLKTDILKEYPIPIADNESLLFFDNQIKPIFNKILKNQTQIRTLTALRDTLLPKLMSGEVRVSEQDLK